MNMNPSPLLRKAALTILGFTAATSTLLHGQSAAQKGYAIAAAADRSDNGFRNSTVRLKMVLKTSSGRKTERILELETLERENENVGDKSLVVFSSPRDIKGTALLSHAKLVEQDDQWLYLPALKRVKRISSKNKSGPFVGSEFAFEDFSSQELNKYTYKWLREETFEGMSCDVVERRPKYAHSGYTRTIAWIDQKHHQFRKAVFYDRKDAKLKTLRFLGYKHYQGKYWRPHKMAMVNHQTGKSTDLLYASYRFGTGLKKSDFVSTVMNRTR